MRAIDEQAAFERFGHERAAFYRKFHAEHAALAANFLDEIEFRPQLFQARTKFIAACTNISEKLFVLDDV